MEEVNDDGSGQNHKFGTVTNIEDQRSLKDAASTNQQLSTLLGLYHTGTDVETKYESTSLNQTNAQPPTNINIATKTRLICCTLPVASSEVDRRHIRQSNRSSICILILGFATAAAFFALGISSLKDSEDANFEFFASDLYYKLNSALDDYIFTSSLIHINCRSRNFTREDFRNLYEYIIADDLVVKAIDYTPKVLDSERALYENEAREYYAKHYPYINYSGFIGYKYSNSTTAEPRMYSDVYYPVHYLEPIKGNERAIDLDYYASGSRRQALDKCLETGQPTITDRLKLVQNTSVVAYGVVILHPGVNITSQKDVWPRDLAAVVIRIPDLLRQSAMLQSSGANVYLFDLLDVDDILSSYFLGAVQVRPYKEVGATPEFSFLPEITMSELDASTNNLWYKDFSTANKIWRLVIVPDNGLLTSQYLYIILGGVTIVLASIFLAYSVHTRTRRIMQCNELKRHSEMEKAALIVENAKQSAKSERELNDFIAHEVRNPVAAAMAACSLVQRATQTDNPKLNESSWSILRGDIQVISNALYFINDLLRSMLDMHRATSQQLNVTLESVDVLHDIIEPVHSILFLRDKALQVQVECSCDIYAIADKLRLKQVLINLGRNSTKFVEKGFIRFCARKVTVCNSKDVKNDCTGDNVEFIEFSVEDSGPGIPVEKRENTFKKYQDSLDGLAQGTGIGLYLCKKLVSLMGGDLSLDETYDSGIPGCPGTRIFFSLMASPAVGVPADDQSISQTESSNSCHTLQVNEDTPISPEGLSVLFVDDDAILRKLFSRVVNTVAPTWKIRQASNGETAIHLTDTETFDLIFMDMYMASVEKQLLGTETVVALRAKGITCRICGLSANDKEIEFVEAGADTFLFKPFPCEVGTLTRELSRILSAKSNC